MEAAAEAAEKAERSGTAASLQTRVAAVAGHAHIQDHQDQDHYPHPHRVQTLVLHHLHTLVRAPDALHPHIHRDHNRCTSLA